MKIVSKIVGKENNTFGGTPATIAFLGDSVTQGCFENQYSKSMSFFGPTEFWNSFSAKLQKILYYLCPKAQINIINSGVGGDWAANGVTRFDRDITPFSPDLVVVGYALNDCNKGLDGIAEYKDGLDKIFKKVKEIGAECIFLTPNMMNDRVSDYLKDETLISVANQFINNCLEDYVLAAKEVANENGVVICDVYSKWKCLRENGVDTTELLANKINHPTREMHWLTAMMLTQTIFEN